MLAPLDATYTPFVWDELLLDAEALIPRLGPTLVLAYAAIETMAEQLCCALARSTSIPVTLWTWLTDRGDFRKDPSTNDFLDKLLYEVCGKSLKSDAPLLWESYLNLRDVRNNYIHTGRLNDRKGSPIDLSRATHLLQKARDIVSWLEAIAPKELQRRLELETKVEVPLRWR
jgi:hypothetical protein